MSTATAFPTPTAPVAPHPTRNAITDRIRKFGRAPRVMGVDVARGLAVIGMMTAHLATLPELQWGDPSTWSALVEGRSSILFALVAGISLALMSGGAARPTGEQLRSTRLRMAARAIVILAIGLVLELFGTPFVVILSLYGVLFLLMLPFIGLRRRTLVALAVAIALLGPALSATLQTLALNPIAPGVAFLLAGTYKLTTWMPLMLAGIAIGRTPLQGIRTAAALLVGGILLAAVGYTVGNAVNSATGGMTEGVPVHGDTAAPSIFGPGAGAPSIPGEEIDLTGKMCDVSEDIVFCMGGTTAEETSEGSAPLDGGALEPGDFDAYLTTLGEQGGLTGVVAQAAGVAAHSGGTFETIGSGGFAIAVVGACLLLSRPLRWLLIPIAAVGTMPLTAYALHIVSAAILMWPLALVPGIQTWPVDAGGNGFWLVSVMLLLVGCTAWAFLCGKGPLERLVARAAVALDGRASLRSA